MADLAVEIDLARRQGEPSVLSEALAWLGHVLGNSGRIPEADASLREAREIAQELGQQDLICWVLLAQARLDSDAGRHAAALAGCRAAVEPARGLRYSALVRQALFVSATSLCHLGEHDLAVETFEEARMLLCGEPHALGDADRQVAMARYAAGQAQAWLMRGGLLLEAGSAEAAADAMARARALSEQACDALARAAPRFSHAALFGLVRVLLEAGDVGAARSWMSRVDDERPTAAPADSLALAQWRLSRAMIDMRAHDTDPQCVLEQLQALEQVPHPRVTGGDLRLAWLRCRFEAHEHAGQFALALSHQQQWSQAKARLRRLLAREHERWARETLAALRTEAHEFLTCALRAPLLEAAGALDGQATIASGEAPAAGASRLGLHRARHSVSRAIDIADQYLGVMRAEHLRPEDLQVLDLASLVEDVCEQMMPPTGAAVQLVRSVERTPLIRGDRVLLMRALGNLLSNAFKHAPAESAVRVELKAEDGGARLTVTDEGPGMPLDMRVRLFQRFATGAVRKGNGLGLAMVARAARVHQARITVDSEPGRGTAVSLMLGMQAHVE